MAHYRKKHPTKVQGNKCGMCQWNKMMGNSRSPWVRKARDHRAYEAARCQLEALSNDSHR